MKNSQLNLELREIERVIRAHSNGHSEVSLDAWLDHTTLRRFQEWVPRPAPGEVRLLDVGCYQPTIGYYSALGWREVIGIAKEEGECNGSSSYQTETGTVVKNLIIDLEVERIPEPDGTIDAVLMMEVFEHFGLDPMQPLAEVNRVLKPSGLLVFSTPNAVSIGNMRRMMHGRGPYAGLEFSGFSTNRHNRIYDAEELLRIMEAAGFEVEVCTSRSYSDVRPEWRMSVFNTLLKCNDARLHSQTGRRIERGSYLFVRARKCGPVMERYPRVLYFDPTEWPDWFKAISQKGQMSVAKGILESASRASD
jgi:2-polyprenyl-3-methyl-5-hydroxy-6-metoxy-1,4-benzoquinol methylase